MKKTKKLFLSHSLKDKKLAEDFFLDAYGICECRFFLGATNPTYRWRDKPIEKVIEELLLLEQLGVRVVNFSDEDFIAPDTYGIDRIVNLTKAMMAKGINISFRINARVKSVFNQNDKQVLALKKIEMPKLLKQAELVKFFLGFESGRYGKGYKLQKFIVAKSILDELGIEHEQGFISVDPLRTLEELHTSLLFIKDGGCIPYIPSIYKELHVQKGNISYLRQLKQCEQQKGINLVGDVLFDEQRHNIIGYVDNRIAIIVKLMRDYIDENYKKYYEVRRMTQYDESHSEDDTYSIIEKLRYNDYDLLQALTQSLIKGGPIPVQYNIIDKHRQFRDVLLGPSSGCN